MNANKMKDFYILYLTRAVNMETFNVMGLYDGFI
jgi:hypothetical protein